MAEPLPLFRLSGFTVRLDPSWFVLAFLVVWSLAAGYFPAVAPDLSSVDYVIMGIAGAVGLLGSIVFHELWHSLVARRFGLPMRGITLFIFGGVSELEEEPADPLAESLMAAAGPLASAVAGIAFLGLASVSAHAGWSIAATAVLRYLGGLNFLLAGFNLLPGFPLDGGRLLRAGLWALKKNMRWATQVAARVGSGFGLVLMLLGALNAFSGNVLGGMWWFVIGLFLRQAAERSYGRLVVRETFAGRTIDEMIDRHPPCVSSEATVRQFVDDYVLRYDRRTFPVMDGSRLAGYVSARRLRDVPRERWGSTRVRELTEPCRGDSTVGPGAAVANAAGALRRSGNDSLIVATDSTLVGTVDAEEFFRHLAVRLEVDEAAGADPDNGGGPGSPSAPAES